MFKSISVKRKMGSLFVVGCLASLSFLQVVGFCDGRNDISAIITSKFNSQSELQRGQDVAAGVKQTLTDDFERLPKGRHNIRWYGDARFALCSSVCGKPVNIDGANAFLEYVYLDVTPDSIKVGVPEKFVSYGGISPSELESILNTLFIAQLHEINNRLASDVVKQDKIAQWR